MERGVRRRFLVAAGAAMLTVALCTSSALAFGTGGKVLINLGGVNSPAGLLKDSKGRLIVPASSNSFDFAVARFTANGQPDTSFSGDGKTSTDVSSFDSGNAGVVTKGDKIVLAGSSEPGSKFQSTLVSYKSDGSLDHSFAGHGVEVFPSSASSSFNDIANEPEGKLVAVGNTGRSLTVSQFKASGKVDKSFSKDGVAKLSLKAFTNAQSVAVQRDGRILVAGSTSGASMSSKVKSFVARFNANGSLDHSFGRRGIRQANFKGFGSFSDLAVTRKGTIYVAGSSRTGQATKNRLAVYSFTAKGGVNHAFSKDGVTSVLSGLDSQGVTVLLEKDGDIVVGGRSDQASVDWLLARFTSKGKLDRSFSHDGTVTTDFGSGDVVAGLVEQGKGKIVGAGYGNSETALARYKRNGSLDG